MTLGQARNDQYRAATHLAIPAPVSGRITCTTCKVHKSCGQFPLGSAICIKCAPQGATFRRGQLGVGPVANFKEDSMPIDEQQILKIIAGEPLVRTMVLADRLDCDIETLDVALAPLLERGVILAAPVMAPNNRRATGYTLSDQARGEIARACTGVDIDSAPVSNLVKAMAFVQEHPGATSAQLHAHLGLAPDALVSTELADALADGRLIKDGKNWITGQPAATSPFAALEPAPAPFTPQAPRATKGQMAVEYLAGIPGQRCTQEQMRVAIGLPEGGQPGPYLKTVLATGQVLRNGTDWVLAAVAEPAPSQAVPAPPAAIAVTLPPAPIEDDHEALTFNLVGIGDVKSEEPGSGARYNSGKAPFELIPAAMIAGSIGIHTPANRAIAWLGEWQEGGGQDALLEVVRELGLDGWQECAHVFDYGRRKYAEWNWAKGMKWSVPFACAQRHLLSMVGGEVIDPESGLPHRGHVICNVVMLWTYHRTYLVGDDRPKKELIA